MHDLIEKNAGHRAIATMTYLDTSDVDLERLEAERRAEAKRKAAGPAERSRAAGTEDLGEIEADGLVELLERARTRIAIGSPPDELAVCRNRLPSMWSYRTSTTRSGRSGTNERSFFGFQRLPSALRGVRASAISASQSQGCPSNVVTHGCSSARSARRRSIGKAPITPTLASTPASS